MAEPVLSLDIRDLSDMTTSLDDLTPRMAKWRDPVHDPGLATVEVQSDMRPASYTSGRVVVVSLDGTPELSWVIDEIRSVLVTKSEESAQIATATCAMFRSLLNRVEVEPTMGFDANGRSRNPFANTRTFSYGSLEYVPVGWVVPTVLLPVVIDSSFAYTGMPAGFWGLGEPWLGTSTGTLGAFGTPASSSKDHNGYLYFRYEFTLPYEMDVIFAVACDDRGDFLIDGFLLVSVSPAADPTSGYRDATVMTVRLSAGSHVFAGKIVNDFGHEDPGFGAGPVIDGNPMAYTFTAWEIEGPRLLRRLFGAADYADMLQLEFPATPPGMSVRQVANIILGEGQAGGKLAGFTVDGTDLVDSKANAWDLYEYLTVNVGRSLLDVLMEWAQTYCDWDVPGPLDKTIFMWRWRERSNTPGVTYNVALGNLDLLEELDQDIVADQIISRWAFGYIKVPPAGGTRAGFLSLGAAQSVNEADTLTGQQVAVQGVPQTTYVATISPTGAGDVPYRDYQLSDEVTVGPVSERVIEIHGELSSDVLALGATLKDRVFDHDDRIINAISRLAQGTMGGSGLPASPVGPRVSIASYSRTSSITWNPSPPAVSTSPEETPTNSGNLFEMKVTPTPAGVTTTVDTLFKLWISDDNGGSWTDVLVDPDTGSAGILPAGVQPESTIIPIPDPTPGGLYNTRWLWGGITHMSIEITAIDTALTGIVFETIAV